MLANRRNTRFFDYFYSDTHSTTTTEPLNMYFAFGTLSTVGFVAGGKRALWTRQHFRFGIEFRGFFGRDVRVGIRLVPGYVLVRVRFSVGGIKGIIQTSSWPARRDVTGDESSLYDGHAARTLPTMHELSRLVTIVFFFWFEFWRLNLSFFYI